MENATRKVDVLDTEERHASPVASVGEVLPASSYVGNGIDSLIGVLLASLINKSSLGLKEFITVVSDSSVSLLFQLNV